LRDHQLLDNSIFFLIALRPQKDHPPETGEKYFVVVSRLKPVVRISYNLVYRKLFKYACRKMKKPEVVSREKESNCSIESK
jgi:hypothetical protein